MSAFFPPILRPHQAHVAHKNIDELRQFVELELADKVTGTGYASAHMGTDPV